MRHRHILQIVAIVLVSLLWAATALPQAQGFTEVGLYSVNTTLDGEPMPVGIVPRPYVSADLPGDCPTQVPHPFNWAQFRGSQSTLDTLPLPVGAVVRAYEPAGLIVGCTEVVASGSYLLTVYGNDPDTPEKDGPQDGDGIAFTVNGHQAVPAGPDVPVWTPMGLPKVELQACSLPGDFDCNRCVDVGDIQRVAGRWGISKGQEGYYPPYDPDGDGIDMADVQEVAMNWRDSCQ